MEEISLDAMLLLQQVMDQAVRNVMEEMGEDKCFTILANGEKELTKEGQARFDVEVEKLLDTLIFEVEGGAATTEH